MDSLLPSLKAKDNIFLVNHLSMFLLVKYWNKNNNKISEKRREREKGWWFGRERVVTWLSATNFSTDISGEKSHAIRGRSSL